MYTGDIWYIFLYKTMLIHYWILNKWDAAKGETVVDKGTY